MHDWLRPGGNRLAGRLPGISLNADGRREAERVAALLAHRPIEWIVASPLQRTIETAEIIARERALDVESDERVLEWRPGPWEGMRIEDIQSRYPHEWQTWREDPARLRLSGAEPLEEVADRMESACLERVQRGGPGVIVSHQDPLAALLCRLIGMPLGAMRTLDIRTGSITVVRWRAYGVVVEAVNSGIPLG